MNKTELKWNDWGDQKKIPKEIKSDELFLVEVEGRDSYKYRTGIVSQGGDKNRICIIGDHFIWDQTPVRWASIQHLVEEGREI